MPLHDLKAHNPLRVTANGDWYVLPIKFDTNNTSAPDGVDPGTGITVARADVGDYTITFNEAVKPTVVRVLGAEVIGDEAELDCKVTGYTASTGVLTISAYQSEQAASGTITCVTKANFADSDYMTIDDGCQTAVVYEFDTAGDGVTAGRVQVNISGDTTAADCAATLATAIGANQPAITVTDNGDGTLSLAHNFPGTAGNKTITENVANAGFLVSGLSGGTNKAVADSTDKEIQITLLCSKSGLASL